MNFLLKYLGKRVVKKIEAKKARGESIPPFAQKEYDRLKSEGF